MLSDLQYQQIYDISSSNSSSPMPPGNMFSPTANMSISDSTYTFNGDDINMAMVTPSVPRQQARNPPPMYHHSRHRPTANSTPSTSSPSPFSTGMVTPVGILQTASHVQLAQAPNMAYMNMVKERDCLHSEITELRSAYELLLGRVQAGTGLIVSPDTNNWAQLRREDYPAILYWTEADYNKKQRKRGEEGSMKSESKVNRGKNADLGAKRESMSYVEYEDGGGVIEADARLICNYMRKIFADIQKHGEAVGSWADVSSTATKYVYQEMYRVFPYLRLCRGHWKLEKLAGVVYTGWYRPYRDLGDGSSSVKVEVKVEKVPGEESSKRKQPPTSTDASKPSKLTKTDPKKTDPETGNSPPAEEPTPALHLTQESSNPATTSSSPASTTGKPTSPVQEPLQAEKPTVEEEKSDASAPPVVPRLNLVNPLASFSKPKPATQSGESGTSDTSPTTMGSDPSGAPPGSTAVSNDTPKPPAPAEPAPSGAATAVPPKKKSALFKFNKTSCATWNLFGAEWAPKQSSPPTKDDVVEAFEKLSPAEKEAWAEIRKAALKKKAT